MRFFPARISRSQGTPSVAERGLRTGTAANAWHRKTTSNALAVRFAPSLAFPGHDQSTFSCSVSRMSKIHNRGPHDPFMRSHESRIPRSFGPYRGLTNVRGGTRAQVKPSHSTIQGTKALDHGGGVKPPLDAPTPSDTKALPKLRFND